MKKIKSILLASIILLPFSCVTNNPVNYTTWHCVENSELGSRTYLINLYKAKNDSNTYLISNFHKVSYEGVYDVILKNTNNKLAFTPTSQQIGDSQFQIRSGSGTMNTNFTLMTLDYNIYDSNEKRDIGVHAVYSRD